MSKAPRMLRIVFAITIAAGVARFLLPASLLEQAWLRLVADGAVALGLIASGLLGAAYLRAKSKSQRE